MAGASQHDALWDAVNKQILYRLSGGSPLMFTASEAFSTDTGANKFILIGQKEQGRPAKVYTRQGATKQEQKTYCANKAHG